MDWAYLFEISLTGLASGGLYALAALAFVMVYKATRVVNIAIGEMLMAGAYLFFTFSAMWALPLWLAIPAAVLASGVLGAVIERTVIRPLLGEPPISVFMVTVGLGSVLVGLVEILWSADQRRLPDFMPTSPIMVGDAFLAPKVFWGAVVAALFVAAVVFIVGNTIRLTVISRAREIEVMKLVGATDWFIRWPFLVEGMVLGLVGAAISGLLLFAGYNLAVRYITGLAPFIPVITAPEPVAALCVALLLMGVLMGAVAGGVFVKRYLRV